MSVGVSLWSGFQAFTTGCLFGMFTFALGCNIGRIVPEFDLPFCDSSGASVMATWRR